MLVVIRAALKYHREKRDEDCVPDGSGKAVSCTQIISALVVSIVASRLD